MDYLETLRKAMPFAKSIPHAMLPMGPEDLGRTGLKFAKINHERSLGFAFAGVRLIRKMAAHMHSNDPVYMRATSLREFEKVVANAALDLYETRDSLGSEHVVAIENAVDRWFEERTAPLQLLIPCAIHPFQVEPFSIGPVTFVHAADLATVGVTETSGLELMDRMFRERGGCWIASVTVEAEQTRQRELAELAVDLALAALHIAMPEQVVMCRLTGRARHNWSGIWTHTSGWVSGGIDNLEPGRTMSPEFFSASLAQLKPILDEFGTKIASFINVRQPMPRVESAWCDSIYWYLEAIQDDIDATAIAKFEICLENLAEAESLHKSSSRIRTLLRSFLRVSGGQPILEGATLSTADFVSELVTGRSRILHGTSSTLSSRLQLDRREAAEVTRRLLLITGLNMGKFLETHSSQDSMGDYGRWAASLTDSEAPTPDAEAKAASPN